MLNVDTFIDYVVATMWSKEESVNLFLIKKEKTQYFAPKN